MVHEAAVSPRQKSPREVRCPGPYDEAGSSTVGPEAEPSQPALRCGISLISVQIQGVDPPAR